MKGSSKYLFSFPAVSSFSLQSALSPLVGSNIYVKPGAEIRVYHLVRPEVAAGDGGAGGQETAARAVPEVFLTRLLATKGETQVSSSPGYWPTKVRLGPVLHPTTGQQR